MFGGKKIAPTNTKIQIKPPKNQTTKVTQQIIGNNRKIGVLANPQIKTSHQKSPQALIDKRQQFLEAQIIKISRSKEKYRQTKISHLSAQKNIENVKKVDSKHKIENHEKNFHKNEHMEQKPKPSNENSKAQKQNIDKNCKQSEKQEESELSGEHDFIQYSQQQYQQEEEQQRCLPIPISNMAGQSTTIRHDPPLHHNQSSEIPDGNPHFSQQFGLNMEVFELEVDQIMAKQYFIV